MRPIGSPSDLLEAQAAWISTHDRVKLRRALLALLTLMDE
jgi:hypothetical protein